jgi:hypothetical protein
MRILLKRSSDLKRRTFAWWASSTMSLASHRTRNSGPRLFFAGATPWFVSATKTFPPPEMLVELAGTTDACVLNPVVAPHSRPNTTTFKLPSGEGYSAKTLFSQGLHATVQAAMRATAKQLKRPHRTERNLADKKCPPDKGHPPDRECPPDRKCPPDWQCRALPTESALPAVF